MRRWLPVGLVVLLGVGSACNGRKAEEARAAAARAQAEAARRAENEKQAEALGRALVQITDPLSPAKAREDFKLARTKAPARHHDAIAKLETCQADGIEQVQKAAEQKGYATIATVAVGCIVSMEDLRAEARRALLQQLLSDKPTTDDGRETALLKLQNATRDTYVDVMILLLDLGPEEARAAAFDAAAAEVAKRAAAGTKQEALEAILQRAHKGEKTPESKARMSARLKELGVPLTVASPAPAPAGAGS